jgi:hypothetical protein
MTLKQIRADFDARTLVVYQAYRSEIADAALAAQRFVAPFSMTRMTWIKPSFLWMMGRCGWATKHDQQRVLAVRITREGFEQALSQSTLTRAGASGAAVQVQWDPERSLRGGKLAERSIQVGLGRQVVRRYIEDWIVSIEDLTPLVARLRKLREEGEWERAAGLLPVERPYPLPAALGVRLGATAV